MDIVRGLPGSPATWAGPNGNIIRPGLVRLGQILGANLNSTADQAIAIGSGSWIPTAIIGTNVSTTLALSLAAGGVYPAASKGGTAIVAAAQVYTALTGSTLMLPLTIVGSNRYTQSTIYFSLTTAHGSAATMDLYVFGYPLDP